MNQTMIKGSLKASLTKYLKKWKLVLTVRAPTL